MVRSVLWNWTAMILIGGTSILLTPFMIHTLGDSQYGVWVLVGAVLDYCGLVDFGMRAALHRFVGRFLGTGDAQALSATVSTALLITIVMAGGLAGVSMLVALALPRLFSASGVSDATFFRLVLLYGLSLSVMLPARLLAAVLAGLQRFDLYNAGAMVTVAVRTVAIAALLSFGYGVVALSGIALGTALFSVLLNAVILRRHAPWLSLHWRHASRAVGRELLSYSKYAFLGTLGEYLRSFTDSIVIAKLLGVHLITPFSVAATLMAHFRTVVAGFSAPLMPIMSGLDALGDARGLRRLFLRSTRWCALLAFGIGGFLISSGGLLLSFWVGDRFAGSYPVLLTLTVGYMLLLGQSPANVVVFARARHRALAVWLLLEGLLNLLLSSGLGLHFGLLGVAAGTVLPMLLMGLVVQPAYAVRAVGLALGEYWRRGLLRPAATLGLFLLVDGALLGAWVPDTALALGLRLCLQAMIYGGLAWRIGLEAGERRLLLGRWVGTFAGAPRGRSRRVGGSVPATAGPRRRGPDVD